MLILFFCNPDNGNFELFNNSPCLGAGENGVDIGAFGLGCYVEYNGPVWHVATNGVDDSNGSLVTPFQTIQKGIDTAEDGDTVLVSPGTYVENINFNGKNIVVGSMMLTSNDTSYISSTIIDGNELGAVVIIVENGDSTAILDGFTITNGLAGNGGGITLHNTSPTLRNLIVSDNVATDQGGGIFGDINSSPTIVNSLIINNTAELAGGGLAFSYDCEATLNGVTIEGNVSNSYNLNGGGGGYFSVQASSYLINVKLLNNYSNAYGGGIRGNGSRGNFEKYYN